MSSDPLPTPQFDRKPVPPTSGTVLPLTADPSQVTTTGFTPNVGAGLSTVGLFVTGLIFLVQEKRNPFIRFWAMQATFYGVAWVIFNIVTFVIGIVLSFIPIINILWWLFVSFVNAGIAVGWLALIVLAFLGNSWEIPGLGKMAREQLARMPTA